MKKLHVIYNHNIFDEPYKQSEVKKTEKNISDLLGDLKIFISLGSNSNPNPFAPDADLITVEHTFDMTAEEKKALALILNTGVTKLKSAEPSDVIVSFKRISADDLY